MSNKKKQPIYYSEETKKFWEESVQDGRGVLIVPEGKTISVYCREGFSGKKYVGAELVTVKCEGGVLKSYDKDAKKDENAMEDAVETVLKGKGKGEADAEEIDSNIIQSFTSLNCKYTQMPFLEVTKRECAVNSVIVEVFYRVGSGACATKLVLYESCHEVEHRINYWTHFTMAAANAVYQSGYRYPSFHTGGLYDDEGLTDSKTGNIYKNSAARKEFRNAFGTQVFTLLPPRGDKSIIRGHLMANADATLYNYQRASFMYVNVMPQFQRNNNNNWKKLEENLRTFSGLYGTKLDIYTGVADVMSFMNIKLYIYNHKIDTDKPAPKLPVMDFFYKMIISREREEAMVVVCVNNHLVADKDLLPFIHCGRPVEEDAMEDPVPDWSEQTGLFSKSLTEELRRDVSRGYMYTCSMDSFLTALRMTDWAEFKEFRGYSIMRLPANSPPVVDQTDPTDGNPISLPENDADDDAME